MCECVCVCAYMRVNPSPLSCGGILRVQHLSSPMWPLLTLHRSAGAALHRARYLCACHPLLLRPPCTESGLCLCITRHSARDEDSDDGGGRKKKKVLSSGGRVRCEIFFSAYSCRLLFLVFNSGVTGKLCFILKCLGRKRATLFDVGSNQFYL